MNLIAKTLGALAGYVAVVAVITASIALALWLLVPAAFPLLAFTYWQALYLTGLLALVKIVLS